MVFAYACVDIRLNPEFQKHCDHDIYKFCRRELSQRTNNKEADGIVQLCLRKRYVKKVSKYYCFTFLILQD